MKPLTVAHLVATTGSTGVEAHLRVLFEGLRAQGVRPFLICPQEGPLTEQLRARGFEVRFAASRRRAGFLELPKMARAARDAELLHAHGPRVQWWSALLRRTGGVRRAVATLHEFARSGAGSRGPRGLFDAIERWTLTTHDRLIAVSGALRDRVIEATGLSPDRFDVVPNSSLLMLGPPPAARPAAEPRYALAASRLNREKGLDVLVEAVALLAREGLRLPVRVLGEGVERPALEQKARALGVADTIVFAGWARDVAAQMAECAFFLNCSRDEPCAVSVLEAMTIGVPVVATRVGGTPELLAGVDRPALVPADDPQALARALREAWSWDAAQRAAQGRSLQERAYREFSPVRMARDTVATYSRVLGLDAGRAAASPQGADGPGAGALW